MIEERNLVTEILIYSMLINKYVKVYENVNTKEDYVGEGKVIKVLKSLTPYHLCDVIFDDGIQTFMIDESDILIF